MATRATSSKLVLLAIVVKDSKFIRCSNLCVVARTQRNAQVLTYTLGLVDRAPLHGLIAPTRAVAPEELIRAYLALYETLMHTRSAWQAVDAMRLATPDTFVYRAAQWLFQHVWDHYQATQETPEARLERGRRMAANPPDDYVGPPVQPEVFAQLLAEKNREFFDNYRRKFFLCDLRSTRHVSPSDTKPLSDR